MYIQLRASPPLVNMHFLLLPHVPVCSARHLGTLSTSLQRTSEDLPLLTVLPTLLRTAHTVTVVILNTNQSFYLSGTGSPGQSQTKGCQTGVVVIVSRSCVISVVSRYDG